MLTTQRNVSVSNYSQALSALFILYREVLGVKLPWLGRCTASDSAKAHSCRRVLVVLDGNGGKDRVVMLPRSRDVALRSQLAQARMLWEHDRQQQQLGVEVPDALATKSTFERCRSCWVILMSAPP